jgi:hypothetical protein
MTNVVLSRADVKSKVEANRAISEVASAIEAAVRERVGLVVPPVIVEPEAPIEAEIAEA